ncbi:hypothetical protein C2845_PM05G34780 [Panicum miliaceum]|uniref:Uncharacterized protein n=1 Tax=Panicum miliaceum TaxID=4540 RepID=A0A3L6SZD3_PANMI|nr:hypothetical protein C2845_PM05G34780 [Panicum miliaceum]
MGAGHINMSRVMDPWLVYEFNERQCAAHVCPTLSEAALRTVTCNESWRCFVLPTMHPSNLNYPSITVPLQVVGFFVMRTLVNVAPPGTPKTYLAGGTVEWSSKHTVRSPMITVVGLATSHTPTPWKLD